MNKTALITGASSGIGKELAEIHARHSGDLVLVARSKEKLENLKSELEKKYHITVKIIIKDLSLPKSPEEIYTEVTTEWISIDYLINNAGFGGIGEFYKRNWDTDLTMIQLNIVALTALTRLFLPDFVERNNGKILNVSSTASLMPGPMQAVYFATKAYVTSFTYAIAEELHDKNITATALLPGATETKFGKISGMEKTKMFKKTADVQRVVAAGYKGMIAGKLKVISGLTFSQWIMISLIPISPLRIILKQVRRM